MTGSTTVDRPRADALLDVLIRASAGTGKTFQLSNRYLATLNRGVLPEQILATTFTRKAAGEILERILIRLAEAADQDAACAELAQFLGDRNFSRKRSAELLASLTRQLHRVQVSTLDSFFSQIASSFDLELGLPPGWTIVDELTDSQLKSRAIDRVLSEGDVEDVRRLMHLLSTSDAERSVGRLVETTVDNLYSVYRETTADAWQKFPQVRLLSASELADAIKALRAAPLPKHKSIAAAHDKACALAAEFDWEAFIHNGLAARIAAGEKQYYGKDLDQALRSAYARLNTHARGVIINTLAGQTEATRDLLSRFDAAYSRLKTAERAMRFDDVTLALAHAAITQHGHRLAYRLDTRLSHLLLDEFQDTSLQQWQVLRPLAERLVNRSGDDPTSENSTSFFCVGDRKQAIYGWRGGVAEIFDGLVGQLPTVRKEALNKSFRSSPPIIDTVNRIFTGIGNHGNLDDLADAVQEWSARFPEHETALTELPGYACLITAPEPDENENSETARIKFAARHIASLAKQAPGRSIGVLARRNRIVAQLIYELRKLGVPASEEGGNPLTDSAAVQLVLSLMRLADHPGNTAARFHIAKSPIGAELNYTDATDDAAAAALSQRLRTDLIRRGYGPTVERFARLLLPHCNQRELRRLQQLVDLSHGYHNRVTVRTTDFVKYVQQEKVNDPAEADVRAMTVFQAKGLEFDTVVLPDLDPLLIQQPDSFVFGQPDPMEPIDRVCVYRNAELQKWLPDDMQAMFQAARDRRATESLCILYVAVTRAVHALHMIVNPSKPSEKHLPKTMAGLLRAALTDGSPVPAETMLFETGTADWHRQMTEPAKPETPRSVSESPEPLHIKLAPLTGPRQRGLRRAAATSRKGSSLVNLSNVLQPANTAAMDRGTLIHAWFEQINWLDEGEPPDDARLCEVARQKITTSLDIEQLLGEFRTMLRSPAIAETLSQKSYCEPAGLPFSQDIQDELASGPLRLEVHNERRFAVRNDDTLFTGIIDRLVLIYRDSKLLAADVIDFKTDEIPPGDAQALAAKVETYRGQLETYRPAVAKLYGLPPERVSARLLMTAADVVESV